MVHIIKVYFTDPKQNVQIRRLAVNSEVVSRFELLARKIREMFPGLAQGHIEVTWIDSEKDVIHMSSDEELAQALASADDDILRIYAKCLDNQQYADKENQNFNSSPNELHQNVICDGCDKIISGYRYKCLQCRNYDLCFQCNATNKHENHDMIKLVRPIHFSREWVFPGARKIWRSMFGRCPHSFTAPTSTNENKETPKSDSKKTQWPELFDDLLKGGYVSADKLVKDNLGAFLNFIDSVSGNLDIKLEADPPNAKSFVEKQDVKMDEKTTNGPSNEKPEYTASISHPKVVPLNKVFKPKMSKTSEQSGDSVTSGVVDGEERDRSADQCGLIPELYPCHKFDKHSGKQYSAERKDTENSTKPCGLFGDNESEEDWTILNKQEDEKKDTESAENIGAKPKNPNLYPIIFDENKFFNELPNVETKVKEVNSEQADHAQVLSKLAESADHAQVLPKLAEPAENKADKQATLKQNEYTAANYDPTIMNALDKMQTMGFTNEGGWLQRLLLTKEGNINATLDALYPNARR